MWGLLNLMFIIDGVKRKYEIKFSSPFGNFSSAKMREVVKTRTRSSILLVTLHNGSREWDNKIFLALSMETAMPALKDFCFK